MESTYTRPPLLGKLKAAVFCAICPKSTGGRLVLVIKAAPSRPRPFHPKSINIGVETSRQNSDLGKRITYNCTGLITEITDFNEARTFGSYRSTLVAQIQSIANRPSDLTINGHVRLDVMALSEGASYILQRLYFMSTGGDFRIYHRVYLTSWGDWERASMTKIA